MNKFLIFVLYLFTGFALSAQPCNTNNATGCLCEDGTTQCDLLPDLDISWSAIVNYAGGPSEYAQVCNPPCSGNDARLRVTGSTPNIGFGPFTVLGTNYYVCGTDTFESVGTPQNCSDGTPPRNLIQQRIYQKDGNLMTYYDRWSGAMTYHPTHNHNHVDDWCVFTLRIKNENEPDARKWDIVGKGAKIGFCLMDYGSCSTYPGHCRDNNTVYLGGTSLLNGDFPNYGLGGGNYNCSPVIQGISSGYTDIYSESLDMMWIDIPPDICNGEYWIVVEVDPLNHFLESNEDNNFTAVPFQLTQQGQPGNPQARIFSDKANHICLGDSINLTAKAGTSYLWSTGDTTQSVSISTAGSYTVTITDYCGTSTSQPFQVSVSGLSEDLMVIGDSICGAGSATLYAEGDPEMLKWYSAEAGGSLINTGNTFQTPTLNSTTTYYVQSTTEVEGPVYQVGAVSSNICNGSYTSNGQYLIFDVTTPFKLKSVLVDANSTANRTIEVKNEFDVVIATQTEMIPAGISRVTLDFEIPVGQNFQISVNNNSGLFRNSECATFPYEVPGVMSIKNSSGGNIYYYYFYDWEIQLYNNLCTGERTPVTATVHINTQGIILNMPDTVDFTDQPIVLSASPAGGVFSGAGVIDGTFDPAVAGIGGPYVVLYTFIDNNGCENIAETLIVVENSVGINNSRNEVSEISLFPNPNNGQFQLSFETTKLHKVSIMILDQLGRMVWSENISELNGAYQKNFEYSELAAGIYTLKLLVDQTPYSKKLIIH